MKKKQTHDGSNYEMRDESWRLKVEVDTEVFGFVVGLVVDVVFVSVNILFP